MSEVGKWRYYHIYRTDGQGYDQYLGHIIWAKTKNDARRVAAKEAASEGRDIWFAATTKVVPLENNRVMEEAIILSWRY